MKLIKVGSNSRTAAVAGAIAGIIREDQRVEAQAVGAAAVNQVVKALILANEYLRGDGMQVVCLPVYVNISAEGRARTAVKFLIESRAIQDYPAEL